MHTGAFEYCAIRSGALLARRGFVNVGGSPIGFDLQIATG
jgi:hypothetical protein